tara:strand:+ start:1479 stop:1625 length:147 start_codon:yes stop_codon:yes gene_type:complete
MNPKTGLMEFEEALEGAWCPTCEDRIEDSYTYKINGLNADAFGRIEPG